MTKPPAPRDTLVTMLTMFSIAGQILELPLENIAPIARMNSPMPGSENLDEKDMQTMEEGRRLSIKLVGLFENAKTELAQLEKELTDWTPPMPVLERYMKKGPPKL